jgi:hypothetical protein
MINWNRREPTPEIVMISRRRRHQHRRVRERPHAAESVRAHPCVLVLAVALVLSGTGCEESLPPRVDPVEVLHPDVQIVGNTIAIERDTNRTGGDFRLSVKNQHDEVLSDEALIRGTVTLNVHLQPDSVRVLHLGPRDLILQSMLVGSVLTIGVNQRAELLAVWDQRTQSGTPFWTFPSYHVAYDSKGRVFYQSDTVYMSVTTSMQVFEKVQALEITQRQFPVVYELYNMPRPPQPE